MGGGRAVRDWYLPHFHPLLSEADTWGRGRTETSPAWLEAGVEEDPSWVIPLLPSQTSAGNQAWAADSVTLGSLAMRGGAHEHHPRLLATQTLNSVCYRLNLGNLGKNKKQKKL